MILQLSTGKLKVTVGVSTDMKKGSLQRLHRKPSAVNFLRTAFSGTSGSGAALGCTITDFVSSTTDLSFPPSLESKLLGGKCLTHIGSEGLQA